MAKIPDMTDPRYLDEVGWFLYHEKYERDVFGDSYNAERLAYSRLLLEEVSQYINQDTKWMEGKTVVSIGSGCTADLAMFPAAVKIAIDPLLYAYQKLGMLLDDAEGTNPTMYLAMSFEDDLPFLDEFADLVICRNALDHMHDPERALKEMWRILKKNGQLFLSVDIGGEPTPDEPTVFSIDSLTALLEKQFELQIMTNDHSPHSKGRELGVRAMASKKGLTVNSLNKEHILQSYETRIKLEK